MGKEQRIVADKLMIADDNMQNGFQIPVVVNKQRFRAPCGPHPAATWRCSALLLCQNPLEAPRAAAGLPFSTKVSVGVLT